MNTFVRVTFGGQKRSILIHDLFEDRDSKGLPKPISSRFRQQLIR
jgi:hypothetical protein